MSLSSAVLLPDGRLLVAGHAPHTAHYFRQGGGGTPTRSSNYKDATFEIYEPPYLFRGDRPVVDEVLATEKGRSLRLILGQGTAASEISEVVLVRLARTRTRWTGICVR